MTARIFTGTIQAAGAGLPAWRQGMAVNQVKQLLPNAQAQFMSIMRTTGGQGSGDARRIDSYSGWAWDEPNLRMFVHGGGHGDYGGNEVYRLDIGSTVQYVALDFPTPAAQAPLTTNGTQYYQDFDSGQNTLSTPPGAKPASSHTCASLEWIPELNRLVRFGSFSVYQQSGGNSYEDCQAWDLSTYKWTTYANTGSISGSGARARHPVTKEVWGDGGGVFKKWHHSAPTVFTTVAAPSGAYYGAAAINPNGGTNGAGVLLFISAAGYEQSQQLARTLDLGNPGAGWTTRALGMNVITDFSFTSKAGGLVYAPSLNAFVYTPFRGNAIFKIDAATYQASQVATTGDTMPDNQNAAQVGYSGKGGIFTRCGWSESLGGFMWVPSTVQGPYFVRLV